MTPTTELLAMTPEHYTLLTGLECPCELSKGLVVQVVMLPIKPSEIMLKGLTETFGDASAIASDWNNNKLN